MWYAKAWRDFWLLVSAAGVGFSMLQLSPVMTLFAVALMSASATTLVLIMRAPRDGSAAGSGRGPAHSLAKGTWIGSGTVAAASIIAASPPVALLLALLALGSAPPVLRRCATGLVRLAHPASPGHGGPADASAEQPAPGIPRSDEVTRVLAGLSDVELCGLWRSTFWELKKQHTDDECLTLVTLRQSCLDEIDRRDPSGLRAWLASGARASGGPERFLNPPHDPGSAHAA